MSPAREDGDITIRLGHTNGHLDPAKSTAALVAAALSGVGGVSASAGGDGTGVLSQAEGPYVLPGEVGFLWDEANLLQELDAALQRVAHYTDFPGIWGGLTSQRRGSESSFFGFDPQGNARVLSGAAGAVLAKYRYGAFAYEGQDVANDPPLNPFRYGGEVGYYLDVVRRAVYREVLQRLSVRARHLADEWGRWLSVDPEREGVNWYGYVRNNPVVRVDPSGLDWMDPAIGSYPWKIQLSGIIGTCWGWGTMPEVREFVLRLLTIPLSVGWLPSQGDENGAIIRFGPIPVLALPKRFFSDAADLDRCRTLFHEAMHLHCGVGGDNDPRHVTLADWAFYVPIFRFCNDRERAFFGRWFSSATICAALNARQPPGHFFVMEYRRSSQVGGTLGCPCRLRRAP